jgi:acyl carrier protein
MKNEILELIYQSIDEINYINQLQIEKKETTIIFGMESELDSLGLVNLIVSIESNVNEKFNKNFTLTDEKALSQKNSPFRSVSTLTEYIKTLLDEK